MTWYTCSDCDYMNLKDRDNYGFAYCSKRREYYDPSDTACEYIQVDGEEQGKAPYCYITTCVCDILGRDDHCYELDTLRDFRDNYMKKQVDCYSMLREYNVVGPEIVKNLSNDFEKDSIAYFLKLLYIDKAIEQINEKDYEGAVDTYIAMTNVLINKYHIKKDYSECDVDREISRFVRTR